LEENQGAYYYF